MIKKMSCTFKVKTKEKRNPISIRKLFFDIIEHRFFGNKNYAARELKKFVELNTNTETIYRNKKLTPTMISRINSDELYIQYWHLELMARYLDIPLGMILLYTRMQSNIRNNSDGVQENQQILRTLSRISEKEMHANSLDFKNLEEWSEIFKQENKNNQEKLNF